jgi:hypothetical protein
MQKLCNKFEALKISSDSRKKLAMGRFEPSTPDIEVEFSRPVNGKCAAVKRKVHPLWTPVSPSVLEDMRCAKALMESKEDLTESDTESEDQESHVWGHDSCLLATIPPFTTTVPLKRNRSNPQDSQARSTAIHSFLVKSFGQHGLNDCILIADSAKLAPDRAIDFDALVKRRVERQEQWKGRSHGGRRGSRTNAKQPSRSNQANTKGLGTRTRALPDQKKRS